MLEGADYPVIGMGETLRETLNSTNEDEVWDYAEGLREDFGPHGVAVPCLDPIRNALEDNQLVVLEGSRNPAEAEFLEDELGEPTIVCWIAADIEDRVRWFSAREGRGSSPEDDDTAREQLKERTDREREAGMSEYFIQSNWIINNNRSKSVLANEIVGLAHDLTTDGVEKVDVSIST